jgi:hypothetical protein
VATKVTVIHSVKGNSPYTFSYYHYYNAKIINIVTIVNNNKTNMNTFCWKTRPTNIFMKHPYLIFFILGLKKCINFILAKFLALTNMYKNTLWVRGIYKTSFLKTFEFHLVKICHKTLIFVRKRHFTAICQKMLEKIHKFLMSVLWILPCKM